MHPHSEIQRRFRARLTGGERLLGTFLKTATGHATEILGGAGFDFVVVDAEHAPFSTGDIDLMMLAARAAGIASVVRVASSDESHLLQALDCGAAGVLTPHVTSAAKLREIISACRYHGGARGFSNSPRAGEFGARGFADHMANADASTSIIAMIEDPEAVDQLDEIFAVEGLTAAFIGRGDLSARLGAPNVGDPMIGAVVTRITEAARRHRVPLIAHVGSGADPDIARLGQAGVTAFLVSSDQGLLRQGALAARKAFDDQA
ncbi:HpcH/HpaI aldolase family protein [Caulobacter sp.]|uniref:HpcH/HpaI aldolase family protein n=1 Tax=Caulobacter sp. TaxID=78 RepID=UPI002B4A1C11|nr:aldolase/citrate lyase family protein [Caulobacter sp.]HJV43612.1 aldolase/citrate lyase family protein [Caulobacter sp.]